MRYKSESVSTAMRSVLECSGRSLEARESSPDDEGIQRERVDNEEKIGNE